MDFLKGYRLRDITVTDQLLLWIFSPIVLQVIGTLGMMEVYGRRGAITEEMLPRVLGQGTALGAIISLPILIFIIVIRKVPLINRKRKWFVVPGLKGDDWLFLLWYIPVSMFVFGLGAAAVEFLFGEAEAVNQQAIESMTDYIPLWAMFLMVVVVAPIAEEWLFRGLIMFRHPTNQVTWTATIVSAIIFGLVHTPTDIPSAYTYIGMGLMFGYAAKHTGSIEAAIVFHLVNNVIGFIVLVQG